MDPLHIKYHAAANAIAPQRIRAEVPGWGGTADKMEDGSVGQPWHCLPFMEGSTYGLELVYQHEKECQVINEDGSIRFDWDYLNEPGGEVTGGEFMTFFPKEAPGQYLFSTRLDIQPPPGYVLRIEPHPRFFTDLTETVPAAIIANVQNNWWSKWLFIVFKVPPPGGRHIFRKGEPYAQIIFVPQKVSYRIEKMTEEEGAARQELARQIQLAKDQISTNTWTNSGGMEQGNYYKVLASAYAREGDAGIKRIVEEAMTRHQAGLPADKTVAESLAVGEAKLAEHKYLEARAVFNHIISRDPDNAMAWGKVGICLFCTGATVPGLRAVSQAITLQPKNPIFHNDLGSMYRMMGRLTEAETCFRYSLKLDPHDPGILSLLGLTIAQLGRIDEGLGLVDHALQITPQHPLLLTRKGSILAQRGDAVGARALFEAALTADPHLTEARNALAKL